MPRKLLGNWLLLAFVTLSMRLLEASEPALPKDVRLTIETHHKTAEFDPKHALGAGVDGHWEGNELVMLSLRSVTQMLQAGLQPISFRLRTELGVEAWHWNPSGHWSDPQHHQGYWISDAQPQPGKPIILSYGYKLPRRGDTYDEANDDGYSVLDDGDPATFWKSSPYLARPFTGEPDTDHPQWVVIDFGQPVPINAVKIRWAEPYATRFLVEYSNGDQVYFGGHWPGVWKTFPLGVVQAGKGGEQSLTLSDPPVKAQYLRIWMTESSGTAPTGSTDARDRLGYAIREIRAGVTDAAGKFHDRMIHAAGKQQTVVCVSSTDPWHRASDRDPKVEQPGIDLVFRSGVTRGRPVMLSLPVLYDIPDNSAALAAYAKRSGYTIERHELGEEPDGQRVDPRDFGVLYAEAARAIRKEVPNATMGGPSFVTANADYLGISYHEWISLFRKELARRGQSGDLRFLSYESYPFDDVLGDESKQLLELPWIIEDAMKRLGAEHLPLVIGEFNYSAYATRNEVDLGGAMLNVETAALFLSAGGRTAYYYGYEPDKLQEKTGSWGNQLMLLRKPGQQAAVPVATFHALRMLAGNWMDPTGGPHQAFRVKSDLPKPESNRLSAYALKRPDKTWSLLIINKDPARPIRLSLPNFAGTNDAVGASRSLTTYSSSEFRWKTDGPEGHPARNLPPVRKAIRLDQPVIIPAWSISVIETHQAPK